MLGRKKDLAATFRQSTGLHRKWKTVAFVQALAIINLNMSVCLLVEGR